MKPFSYERPDSPEAAVTMIAADRNARFVAGGTNLVDLMKREIETPSRVVDISKLPLAAIEATPEGGLRIGALARNTDVAAHPQVRVHYPALARAIVSGGSPQIRNMATVGGNLMQRTRCPYFFDTSKPCNKRTPGAGCAAIGANNRLHAILGASDACIATHPSDMAVALTMLDAVIETMNADHSVETAPIKDFHRLPGDAPQRETILPHGSLITAVILPPPPAGKQVFTKVAQRAAFSAALVSVAACVDKDGDAIRGARVTLGGVALKPWRAEAAEGALTGAKIDNATFANAADAALATAHAQSDNGFKIPLARRLMQAALAQSAM